jgi:hypothetical protein
MGHFRPDLDVDQFVRELWPFTSVIILPIDSSDPEMLTPGRCRCSKYSSIAQSRSEREARRSFEIH